MRICQHDTFGVPANKADILATNLCESVIAWTVIISAEVNKLLLELLLFKIHIYLYSLHFICFQNIILCIHKFLVPMTRRNVAESTGS